MENRIKDLSSRDIGLSGLHDLLSSEGFDKASIYKEIGRLFRSGKLVFVDRLVNYTSLGFERKISYKK